MLGRRRAPRELDGHACRESMKIVLRRRARRQRTNGRTFEQATVVIGRTASECHIAFDQSHWVSRRHAELRCRDGRWVLVDMSSTFGTFVDGQKVAEPVTVHEGAKLQFGEGGPVVVVLVAEAAAGAHAPLAAAVVELIGPSGEQLERIPRQAGHDDRARPGERHPARRDGGGRLTPPCRDQGGERALYAPERRRPLLSTVRTSSSCVSGSAPRQDCRSAALRRTTFTSTACRSPVVLAFMCFSVVLATLPALRLQDVK